MFPLLVVLFLVVPFAEIAVLIAVGQQIGVADTLILMVGVSVAGAFLARRQGLGVFREIQRRLERGEVPGRELVDGLVVLLAGVLLLTPGFITDGIALLMLLPFVRAGVRRTMRGRFERRVQVFGAPGSRRPGPGRRRPPAGGGAADGWVDADASESESPREGGEPGELDAGGQPSDDREPGERDRDEGSGSGSSNP